MPTSYPTLEDLHQAYATEPDRIAGGWAYWSEEDLDDGSLHVTVTLPDMTTHVWTRAPGGSTLTLQ